PDHAVRCVAQLVDGRLRDRPREARPAATGFELRGRREERLARDDVHVDSGLVIVEELAAPRRFGAALLRDAVLLARQPRDGLGCLLVVGHGAPRAGPGPIIIARRATSSALRALRGRPSARAS